MDYKKIIKSRRLRMAILDLLSFVPDKPMIQLQYRIKTGRRLNLKNPKRYTEKLQWYKLYYRDPLMAQCVDKYEVRKYVKSLGLGHILNECYGVFDKPENIDFDKLPNQFVLKDTLGGGGNSVIICKDKSKADLDAYIRQMNEWVHTKNVRSGGREWPYYRGKHKHRIIIEKYLENKNNPKAGIPDYKFICSEGKVSFIVLDVDRYIHHKRNFYDTEWHYINVNSDCETYGDKIEKPQMLSSLKKDAEKLSDSFPSVRVDLYLIENKIIFGELTFYPWSGYVKFLPDEFDYILGKHFSLLKKGYTLLL